MAPPSAPLSTMPLEELLTTYKQAFDALHAESHHYDGDDSYKGTRSQMNWFILGFCAAVCVTVGDYASKKNWLEVANEGMTILETWGEGEV